MQFRDLTAQYAALKNEIDSAIRETIASAHFISGPQVKELEDKLASYTARKHCISCANGTDALELVLRAWGVKAGDAVFVPAFTFMSTAEVVSIVEATPVFVDIDPATYNMSPASLEEAVCRTIAEKKLVPRAIIPVDLFGQPADFRKILDIAAKYDLLVLEDGAQGFGGMLDGRMACSFGEAATTSFFPAKPLGCYGDGGAIFTDDDNLAQLLRSLCIHGKGKEKYENIRIGRNSRLDSLQAAILLPKFKAFAEYELDAVNRCAGQYTELLSAKIATPAVMDNARSSWAQYTILCDSPQQRATIQNALKAKAIPSMIYYPCGLHLQKAFSGLGYGVGSLPATEQACMRVLSLPMHPYLTEAEIGLVAETILSCI